MNIDKIIKESIDKVIRENVVDKFTPYTPEEAEQNKRGLGRMGNPSYNNAKKANTSARPVSYKSYEEWKAKYQPKGISWQQYQSM